MFWLSRGSKNNAETIDIASKMNSSECVFSHDEEDVVVVSYEWGEEDEDR